MQKLTSYFQFQKTFLFVSCLLVCINSVVLLGVFCSTFLENQSEKFIQPGIEFADLKEKLKNVEHAGFLTNKDMSPERNDGQFLAAQYMLAPIVLDLDNKNHRFIILDCTSWFFAYVKTQEIGAAVIYTNPYGKVLAEKKP